MQKSPALLPATGFSTLTGLNIASAHHFLGLAKVTEKLQNWQEIDIISEGQNWKYINLIEFH